MEAEREDGALALHTLVRHSKLDLGQRERVAQMQLAVHVRVRESGEEFFWARLAGRGRVELEGALGVPSLLHAALDGAERVALDGRLDLGQLRLFGHLELHGAADVERLGGAG